MSKNYPFGAIFTFPVAERRGSRYTLFKQRTLIRSGAILPGDSRAKIGSTKVGRRKRESSELKFSGPVAEVGAPVLFLRYHRPVSLRDELLEHVRDIPRGRVTNYGALGRALSRSVSGVIVGRWLSATPEDVPWWRVVGRDGRLPIWKKDPSLESLQAARLTEEGVELVEGVVAKRFFVEP